jgi:hypothetical protein
MFSRRFRTAKSASFWIIADSYLGESTWLTDMGEQLADNAVGKGSSRIPGNLLPPQSSVTSEEQLRAAPIPVLQLRL